MSINIPNKFLIFSFKGRFIQENKSTKNFLTKTIYNYTCHKQKEQKSIHSFSGWILTWVWICCFVSYAIRKIYIWTISNSRDNNFHYDCYKLYIIISWVAICIFMQFNITFKTMFEYVLKKLVLCIQIRFVSTEKTTRIASRASCVIYRITFEVSTDDSYVSDVCGNNFGTRLHDIYYAECFKIRPKYQHRGYACLK